MIDIVDCKHRKHMSDVSKCCVKCLLRADIQMCPIHSILYRPSRHSVVILWWKPLPVCFFPYELYIVTNSIPHARAKSLPPLPYGPRQSTAWTILSVRTKTVAYIADLKVKRSSSANLRTMSLTVGTLLYFDSIRKAQLRLLRWRAHKLRPNHELTQKHKRPHLAGS